MPLCPQNKNNIHTDIYLLRNTCTFPSAYVMHNLNTTVLSSMAEITNTVCLTVASMYIRPRSAICTCTSVEYQYSQCQRATLAKAVCTDPVGKHSLVFIINLLLGKGCLGVLFQGVPYPREGVHLLGTAGRHGDLIARERRSSADEKFAP